MSNHNRYTPPSASPAPTDLVQRALDHAPDWCTPTQVLILAAIAQRTREHGDVITFPMAELARQTHASNETGALRKALRGLTAKGLDVRVPVGHSRTGQPMYAARGRLPQFRLPDLLPPVGCRCPSCEPPETLSGVVCPRIATVHRLNPRRDSIPKEVRARVYARDGGCCVRCGATEDLSLDHIFPWSLDGTDTEDNLQTLCRSCNSSKGAGI